MDIILTGIPRSGTTLTCYLLNLAPDTIALHEPYNPFHDSEAGVSPRELVDKLARFLTRTREALLLTGDAPSKQYKGQIPDNPKSDYPWYVKLLPNRWMGRSVLGYPLLRHRRAHPGIVHFDKPLSDDFTLCVKHNAGYTALLGELATRYRCYAVIRNPLAVLASWNSIDFDLRVGDMTITERLDPNLAVRLRAETNSFERQYMIVEWFFAQFKRYLRTDQMIRYESLVEAPEATLQHIAPLGCDVEVNLTSRNNNRAYNRVFMRQLASMLIERPSVIWDYYPPSAIKQLLATL